MARKRVVAYVRVSSSSKAQIHSYHGIKGMRWGVRRTPEQLGHEKDGSQSGGKSGNPTQNSEDQKKRTKSTATQTMSDEELRSRINRLNMEEQYANLVARQKQ